MSFYCARCGLPHDSGVHDGFNTHDYFHEHVDHSFMCRYRGITYPCKCLYLCSSCGVGRYAATHRDMSRQDFHNFVEKRWIRLDGYANCWEIREDFSVVRSSGVIHEVVRNSDGRLGHLIEDKTEIYSSYLARGIQRAWEKKQKEYIAHEFNREVRGEWVARDQRLKEVTVKEFEEAARKGELKIPSKSFLPELPPSYSDTADAFSYAVGVVSQVQQSAIYDSEFAVKIKHDGPCYDARVYFGFLAFLHWAIDEATFAQCEENNWDEDIVKRFSLLELK